MVILNLGSRRVRILFEIISFTLVIIGSVLSGVIRVVHDSQETDTHYCWVNKITALRFYMQHIWILIAAIWLFFTNILVVIYVWRKTPKHTPGKWKFTSMLLGYSVIFIILWCPYGISRLFEYISEDQMSETWNNLSKMLTSFIVIFHAVYYGYTRQIWKQFKDKWYAIERDEKIQLVQTE